MVRQLVILEVHLKVKQFQIIVFLNISYYVNTNLLTTIIMLYIMSDKKEIQEPGLDTEEAKELELDEQPKPTRKVSHPSTPISNKDEPSTHDKIKGRRTIK